MEGARTCAFCGRGGKMSGEHLWPEWFDGIVPRIATEYTSRAIVEGRNELRGTSKKLASDRVKRVCESCNNGWMSDIENDLGKRYLAPLIQGNTMPLTRDTQRAMAVWGTLRVLVFALMIPEHEVPFPFRRYPEFMERQVPPRDWIVRCGHYTGTRWPCFLWFFRFAITPRGIGRPAVPNAHRTTIVAGNLLIQIIGSDSGIGLPPSAAAGPTISVWPFSDSTDWPASPQLDDARLLAMAHPEQR